MGTMDEWVGKYTAYVDNLIRAFPYQRMMVWKDFFFNPVATLKSNMDSIGQRLTDLYVSAGVEIILGLIGSMVSLLIGTFESGSGAAFFLGAYLLVYALVFIFTPIVAFLYSCLEYLVAKLLGGKADLKAHFNASALPGLSTFVMLLPLTIVSIPLQWLGALPGLDICAGLLLLPLSIISLVVALYGLYLKYLAFKEVHQISPIRTIAVIFAPLLLIIGVILVIALLFMAYLISVLSPALGA